FTKLNLKEFNMLVDECRDPIYNTTVRGTSRKRATSALLLPYSHMVFITLFFLYHYPTLEFMSGVFLLHPRDITRIIKRTLTAMAQVLEKEVKWPSDSEFEDMRNNFTFFQNFGFEDCLCVVDGTEIRVSRPVGWE